MKKTSAGPLLPVLILLSLFSACETFKVTEAACEGLGVNSRPHAIKRVIVKII